MGDESWAIDIPGLTYEQAVKLSERLKEEAQWGVVLIDPRVFMLRGFDRPTVELLASCLRAGLASGDLAREDAAGAQSMLEDCEEWLRHSVGDGASDSDT